MKLLQTSLANNIDATDGKIKYDIQVKKVLSNKWILARILKYTVKEFASYSFSDITRCMEGTPKIVEVALEAGWSNIDTAVIRVYK